MKRKKRFHPDPLSYRERRYRQYMGVDGLIRCRVTVNESDLMILADRNAADEATRQLLRFRSQLESYIARHPSFHSSLQPLPSDPTACPIVRSMLAAGQLAGVGPMAAVAGAVAEFVARELLSLRAVGEIIIENGGDLFLSRCESTVVGIFAGISPHSNRVGIRIDPQQMPLGVCTSSGVIGHSLSLGRADSVTVLSPSTALADAAATHLGNVMRRADDMEQALDDARSMDGLSAVVIVHGERLGAWGDVELVSLT